MGNCGSAPSKVPVAMINDGVSVSDFLKTTEFFKHLSSAQLNAAASKFQVKKYKNGERIINQQDESDGLFCIAEGSVDFKAESANGSTKKIRHMKKGEYFGEFGLVHGTPRSVSVDSVGNTVLLFLDKATYKGSQNDSSMKQLHKWVEASASSIVVSGLKEIPFLSSVTKEDFSVLGRLFKCEVVPKGSVIVQEGEVGGRFYILSRGSLVVTTRDDLGLFVELTRLQPGATFGEVSLLRDETRNATITTLEDSVLFSLGRSEFEYFISWQPTLGEKLEQRVNEHRVVSEIAEKIPVFANMSKRKQHLLAEVCKMERHPKGQIILKEGGSTPRKFFIISRGSVDIEIDHQFVRTLGPGSYFGEVSLVSESPHSATVTVSKDEEAWMLECTQQEFKQLFVGEPAVLAEISLRVLGSKATLEDILRHHTGRRYFSKFVEKEYANENIDFWVAVEKLESISRRRVRKSILGALSVDPSTVKSKKNTMLEEGAKEIWDTFIDPASPTQVNLSSEIYTKIKQKVDAKNYDFKMFHDAKKEIFGLMSKDSFSRFCSSKEYRELMNKIGVYEQKRQVSNSPSE